MRRYLRAVVGTAEDPNIRPRVAYGLRPDVPERVLLPQAFARCPRDEVAHVAREHVSGGAGIRVQRIGRQPVRAGCPPEPKVDPPRRDRLQHAELLGHLQRRIMRQHHPRAADPDTLGGGGDGGDQDLGRRAGLAVGIMVLGHPIAVIAECLGMPRKFQAFLDRGTRRSAGDDRGLIEDGEQHPCRLLQKLTCPNIARSTT